MVGWHEAPSSLFGRGPNLTERNQREPHAELSGGGEGNPLVAAERVEVEEAKP
jgi:hypothetical protein